MSDPRIWQEATERWPGYNEQSWAARFESLNNLYEMRSFEMTVMAQSHAARIRALEAAVVEARAKALEEAAVIADQYAEIGFEMAGDTILLDPCLRGKGFTPENIETSNGLQTKGAIFAGRAHAAQDIATRLRALVGE